MIPQNDHLEWLEYTVYWENVKCILYSSAEYFIFLFWLLTTKQEKKEIVQKNRQTI